MAVMSVMSDQSGLNDMRRCETKRDRRPAGQAGVSRQTALAALQRAHLSVAITHAPGAMPLTDIEKGTPS